MLTRFSLKDVLRLQMFYLKKAKSTSLFNKPQKVYVEHDSNSSVLVKLAWLIATVLAYFP